MSLLRKWGNPTYTNNEGAGGGQTVGGKFDWTPLGAPSPTIPKMQAPKGSLSMFQSSADDKDWDRPRRIRAVKQAMARKREAAMFAAQRNLSRGMYRGGSRYGGSAGFGSFGRRYQGFGKLAKFDPGQARDAQGRWTSGAGAKAIPGAPKLASNRRLWGQYRPDADDPEWKDIEGIDVPEGRVFRHRKVVPRISKVLGPEKTTELARWAGKATKALEKDIVAYGMRAPHMVGKGAEERDVRAAFQHGRVLAMHDVGLVDYWFRFNPENIDTFHRMTPFIRYARRACGAVLRDGRPEEFAQLRREFGTSSEPKKYHRFDTRGAKKGEEKKHFFIHNEVVKGEGAGALAKAAGFNPGGGAVSALERLTTRLGHYRAGRAALDQVPVPGKGMSSVKALAPWGHGVDSGEQGLLRQVNAAKRPQAAGKPVIDLHQGAGGEWGTKHPRDARGRFAAKAKAMWHENLGHIGRQRLGPGKEWAKAGAKGLAGYGGIKAIGYGFRRLENEAETDYASQQAGQDLGRGATTLTLTTGIKTMAKDPLGHMSDLVRRPTRVGGKPTGKQIRRQFLRDAVATRERMIATDKDGRVIVNAKGGAMGVSITKKQQEKLLLAAGNGNLGRVMHNHPGDTVPSTPDAKFESALDAMNTYGRGAATHDRGRGYSLVYGIGQTKDGKVRTRITRYDAGGHEIDKQPRKGAIKASTKGGNYVEADWLAARKRGVSRYRTKAVEKLAPA